MVERHKSPVEEAVDAFLESPPKPDGTVASLSASVPPALKLILRNAATLLNDKAPGREYTAWQIAKVAIDVYDREVVSDDCPIILRNVRAFGRFLQKYGGREIGFVASKSVGNRRTYRPLSRKRSPLDS